MEQRISLMTLGVRDLAVARAFYEALGWRVGWTDGDVAFFEVGGMIVGLWSREKLAEDSSVDDGGGWGGVTLAHIVATDAEVDDAIARARAAGGRIAREPAERPWGGYSGVFVDPDGHPWEVAVNPGWTLHEDGTVTLTLSELIDVCPVDELPLGARQLVAWDDLEIMVVNCGGELLAIEDRCSHDDGPLAEGILDPERCTVECPRHGSLFDLRDGRPLTLPAYQPVESFPVVVAEGIVRVEVG